MGAILALPLIKGFPSWLVRVLLVLAVVAALIAFGWYECDVRWTEKVAKENMAAMKEVQRIAGARQVITERVEIQYLTKTVPQTRTVTETIERQVTSYVDRKVDVASLSTAAVELHDAAAANRVPDTARSADDAASGLEAAALTRTCAANYAICHQNADQLRALQGWLADQAVVK